MHCALCSNMDIFLSFYSFFFSLLWLFRAPALTILHRFVESRARARASCINSGIIDLTMIVTRACLRSLFLMVCYCDSLRHMLQSTMKGTSRRVFRPPFFFIHLRFFWLLFLKFSTFTRSFFSQTVSLILMFFFVSTTVTHTLFFRAFQ